MKDDTKDENIRVNIQVSRKLRAKLKIKAFKEGKTVRKFLTAIIEEAVK